MPVAARLLLLLVLLATPGHLYAQQGRAAQERPVVSAGTFVGLGSGPSGSAVWGVEGTIPFSRLFAVRAEYSRWGSGVGAECLQRWPDSYACSVSGWAGLAGIRVSAPVTQRIAPFADVSAGRFTRKRVAADPHSTTAVSLGVGARVQLLSGLSARVSGGLLRPYDDDYEALMGEKLLYTTAMIGLEYRITR